MAKYDGKYIFLFVCLFFLTFSTKFEWQNTIPSGLVLTLSSIFISSEEMNRRIIFAVKQWNWLYGISSIYFPCLLIYQWCLLELNSCRWKVQKELSLNKVYWSQFSVSLHPSIFWFLEFLNYLWTASLPKNTIQLKLRSENTSVPEKCAKFPFQII